MAGITLTVAAGQETGHLRPLTIAPKQKFPRGPEALKIQPKRGT